MSRGTKRLLKTALTLLIIGAAFCIASLCLGFSPREFEQAVEEGRFQIGGSTELTTKVITTIQDAAEESMEFNESYAEVDSIELDVGAAECVDGQTFSERDHRNDHHAEKEIEMDCGIGEVEIQFE